MFKVGMQVYYKGSEFWIVSVPRQFWIISVDGDILELAPTPHGAGSFYATAGYVDIVA